MEGLVLCPPSSTPFLASAARSDGNFFPQKLPSCLFFFSFFCFWLSSPVRQRRSGRCAAWPKGSSRGSADPACVCGTWSVNSHSRRGGMKVQRACEGPPWVSPHRKKKKGRKKNPTGLDSRVRKREKKQNKRRWRHATHTRASGFFSSTSSSSFFFYSFSFSFSFFFFSCCCCCCCCAGCVRLDLWAGNEASLWVCGF